MKLITESTDVELNYITEEKDGKKNLVIEGVFMSANKKNKNARIYPKAVY